MHIAQYLSRSGLRALVAATLLAMPLFGFAQDQRAPYEARDITAFEMAGSRQSAAGNRIYFRSGVFDPVLQRLTVSGYRLSQPATGYGLVQFETGTGDAAERLRKSGMEVIAYQPDNAWLVRWNVEQKTLATEIGGVRFAGDYTAEMKLAPALLQPEALPVETYRLADGKLSPPGVSLEIIGFPDTSAESMAAAVEKFAPEARGIETRNAAGWISTTIWLPESRLQAAIEQLAGVRGVYLLDAGRRLEWHNIDSVEPIQANTATNDVPPSATPIWNQGLIGAGQIVAVMDSGLDNNEDWFVTLDDGSGPNTALTDGVSPVPPATGVSHPDRKVFAYWVQPGATAYDNNEVCTVSPTGFHGTHVAGTVAGDTLATATPTDPAYDDGDGMAPNAQILFQDIGNDNSGCLAISDLFGTLQQAAAGGASIHTNSWGSAAGGAYTSTSATVDAFSRSEENSLVLFSAGNSGSGPNTIGAPATAKNALTVGALRHGNDTTVVGFSSRGPTDDGRTKPDIQAPGTAIRSAAGDTTNDGNIEPGDFIQIGHLDVRTHGGRCGRHAAPVLHRRLLPERVAHRAGCRPAHRRADEGRAAQRHPGRSFLRRAQQRLRLGPGVAGQQPVLRGDARYIRFWDRINEAGLATGETHDYSIDVASGEELRVTLVWTDVAAAAGAGVTLVNDLDLQVTAPGGAIIPGQRVQRQRIDHRRRVRPGEQRRAGAVDQSSRRRLRDQRDRRIDPGRRQLAVRPAGIRAGAFGRRAGRTVARRTGQRLGFGRRRVRHPGRFRRRGRGEPLQHLPGPGRLQHGRAGLQPRRPDDGTSFVDAQTIGGFEYSYRVRADDGASEGPISACGPASVATSAAACDLEPTFDQSSVTAGDSPGNLCGIDLAWTPAARPARPATRFATTSIAVPIRSSAPMPVRCWPATSRAPASPTPMRRRTPLTTTSVRAEDSTDPADGNESGGSLRVKAVSVGDGSEPGTFSTAPTDSRC